MPTHTSNNGGNDATAKHTADRNPTEPCKADKRKAIALTAERDSEDKGLADRKVMA